MKNSTLLQKADLALSDLVSGGGILLPAQAKTFLESVIKGSELLKLATVVPMMAPAQQFAAVKFGSRVLRAGSEGTAVTLGNRAKPDFSYVELDAKLIKGEVQLSDEVMEDNLERGTFQQTVMRLLSEAVSRDVEELAINGDTDSDDDYLALIDGLLVQAQSNVYDAEGAPLNKTTLSGIVSQLPAEYRRDKRALRFFASTNCEQFYRDSLIERATVAGDKFLETDAPVLYTGTPIIPIPLMPENLGDGEDQSVALLCNPKSIYAGFWRQVRMETDRDVSAGVLKVVVTLRFDCKYVEEGGVAKAVNLGLTE